MNSKKVGIVGFGEIGKAIASFYESPFEIVAAEESFQERRPRELHIQDLASKSAFAPGLQLDMLHVCIPCADQADFVNAVLGAIDRNAQGALVIIHSTVPVGTTALIAAEYPHTVHSPVRGVHPNLAQGIKTFPKYVGADSSGAGRLAAEELEGVGMSVVVLHKSKTSELLKLLDTTYYGLAIAYHDYAQQLCEREGVNFDMAMTEPNLSYNEGYTKLGMPNVARPVLRPLVEFGESRKIGGHCVVPNAEILREQFGQDPLLDAILRHK